ncbi:MAG TPA: hypothetical protein PLB59_13275, partial [Bacteroidales bacterium]|nr:hypothetical protein [Bacteroidales bacterium]
MKKYLLPGMYGHLFKPIRLKGRLRPGLFLPPLLLLGFLLAFSIHGFGQNNDKNTPLGQRSVADEKWQKGGIFEGYTPGQEILEKRTRNTKHFNNPDGSITVQIGGLAHYKDENGAWQDVDYSIKINNSDQTSAHKYANKTSEIKSFFPESPGSTGVMMRTNGLEYKLWANPEMEIVDDANNVVYSEKISSSHPQIDGNKIIYPSYDGISENMSIFESGIQNDIVISYLNS